MWVSLSLVEKKQMMSSDSFFCSSYSREVNNFPNFPENPDSTNPQQQQHQHHSVTSDYFCHPETNTIYPNTNCPETSYPTTQRQWVSKDSLFWARNSSWKDLCFVGIWLGICQQQQRLEIPLVVARGYLGQGTCLVIYQEILESEQLQQQEIWAWS